MYILNFVLYHIIQNLFHPCFVLQVSSKFNLYIDPYIVYITFQTNVYSYIEEICQSISIKLIGFLSSVYH